MVSSKLGIVEIVGALRDIFFSSFLRFLLFVFLVICIWFLFREIRCWYWKINKIADSLDRIAYSIDFIAEEISSEEMEETEEAGEIKETEEKEIKGDYSVSKKS